MLKGQRLQLRTFHKERFWCRGGCSFAEPRCAFWTLFYGCLVKRSHESHCGSALSMADTQETCDPNRARKASSIEKPQTLPNQYSLAVVLSSAKQNRTMSKVSRRGKWSRKDVAKLVQVWQKKKKCLCVCACVCMCGHVSQSVYSSPSHEVILLPL